MAGGPFGMSAPIVLPGVDANGNIAQEKSSAGTTAAMLNQKASDSAGISPTGDYIGPGILARLVETYGG